MSALRRLQRPRLWLGAWVAMLAATFVVCLVRLPPTQLQVENVDKLEHLVGYGILAAYAAGLFATRRAWTVAALGLIAMGMLIEGLQAMTSWRSFSAADALANALGTMIGIAVAPTRLGHWLQTLDSRVFASAA